MCEYSRCVEADGEQEKLGVVSHHSAQPLRISRGATTLSGPKASHLLLVTLRDPVASGMRAKRKSHMIGEMAQRPRHGLHDVGLRTRQAAVWPMCHETLTNCTGFRVHYSRRLQDYDMAAAKPGVFFKQRYGHRVLAWC